MNEFEISEDCVVKLGTAGAPGTAIDVSDFFKTLKTAENVGNEDITTFGTVVDAAKIYAYLLGDQTFDCECLWTAEFWKHVGDLIKARKKPILEIYRNGEVSGGEKWSCFLVIENRNRNFGVNEVDKGSITMKRSGALTEIILP